MTTLTAPGLPASSAAASWPDVAVVIPAREAAAGLRASLDAVLAQDYPGTIEVAVAVAPSSDDTGGIARAAAAADPRVRVVDNADGRTPAGLNAAIAATSAPVVARVDAHAIVAPGYLRRAVTTLESTGADNVGGIQEAVGETPFEQSVAAAMTSRFGVGNATFHYGGAPGPVDTVYLGVFRRSALQRVGGFDESLIRNQDYELNWRIRASGGTVWFDPELRVRYRPRSSLRALARQYFEYGRWKRVVLRRHPSSVRARQLVPPAALTANAGGLLLGLAGRRLGFAVPAVYAASVAVAAGVAGRGHPVAVAARLPAVFATMHMSWGAGFLTSPASLADG